MGLFIHSFFAFHDYHYFDPILRASGRLPNYNEKIVQILHVYAFPKKKKKTAQNAQWAVIVHEKVHLKETARHNLPQKSKQCAFCNCFKCNSTKVFIVLFFHFSPILHRQNGKRKCRFAISLAKLGYKILLHMSC